MLPIPSDRRNDSLSLPANSTNQNIRTQMHLIMHVVAVPCTNTHTPHANHLCQCPRDDAFDFCFSPFQRFSDYSLYTRNCSLFLCLAVYTDEADTHTDIHPLEYIAELHCIESIIQFDVVDVFSHFFSASSLSVVLAAVSWNYNTGSSFMRGTRTHTHTHDGDVWYTYASRYAQQQYLHRQTTTTTMTTERCAD